MKWRPRLTVDVGDERIRVTSEGGASIDEPAALVVCFMVAPPRRSLLVKAPPPHQLRILAVGKEAASFRTLLAEQAQKGVLSSPPEHIVPADRAVWWPSQPGKPLSFDPSLHENECIVVWPVRDFERDGGSLFSLIRDLIYREAPRWALSIHLDLTDLPSEPAKHDVILRACWDAVGRDHVTLRGQPAELRGPRRTWREVPSSEVKRVAGGFAVYPAVALLSFWPWPSKLLAPVQEAHFLWPFFLFFGLLILSSELWKLRTWVRS